MRKSKIFIVLCLVTLSHTAFSGSIAEDLLLDFSDSKDEFVYPMDGSTPHYKFKAANNGTNNLIVHFNAYCNGGGALASPQGDTLLKPDEYMYIKLFLEGARCAYDENTQQTVNVTLSVDVCDNNFENTYTGGLCLSINRSVSVEIVSRTTLAGAVPLSGQTYDSEGNVLPYTSMELGGYGGKVALTTDSEGMFSYSIAVGEEYIIIASKEGYRPETLEINGSEVGGVYRINLTSETSPLDVNSSSLGSLSGDIGFWKAYSTSDESRLLLINGMENWANPFLKTQSKLYLMNTSTGSIIWTHDMGWEGWCADISGDGKYAAYATSYTNLDTGFYPQGYVNHVDLLNGSDGSLIWRKNVTLDEFPNSTSGEMYSRGVKISNTNSYLLAHIESDYTYLLDITDGSLLWSFWTSQNVRDAAFSPDDEYVYVPTGGGWLYKLSALDGIESWKQWIGSWAYVNGFDVSDDGRYIAVATKGGVLSLVDAETGDLVFQKDIHSFTSTCRFSPDSQRLAVGSPGNEGLIMMDLSGETIWRYYSCDPRDIRFSGDGRLVYTSGGEVFDSYGSLLHDVLPGVDRDASIGWVDSDSTRFVWAARDVSATGNVLETYSLETSLAQECDLEGDDPPCGTVTLSEVIAFITGWSNGSASLADVIALINAWASG